MKRLVRNRDFILSFAFTLGLIWGKGAHWTHPLTLPSLAVAMTLSLTGISVTILRNPKPLITPAISGILMNYSVLGITLLSLSYLLIQDKNLLKGFILIAAVPPAIAVIPFTSFLNGDRFFSLVGMIGSYLGGLLITPLISLLFLGSNLIQPSKILIIMFELIFLPLVMSQALLIGRISLKIEPFKGTIINWCFFLVTYTIVGLNRYIFINRPLSLLLPALIAGISTFLLGWLIEIIGRFLKIKLQTITSLVLLGTLKNYGLAGGLALTLFEKETALPATIYTIFMILYIIWLGSKSKDKKIFNRSLIR